MAIKGRLARDLARMAGIELPKSGRRNKYAAQRTVVNGINFASKKEAKRYAELILLQEAGKIRKLQLQVPFAIVIKTVYKADFTYFDESGFVVEDTKGFRTREYKRKKRLMQEQHKIDIKES